MEATLPLAFEVLHVISSFQLRGAEAFAAELHKGMRSKGWQGKVMSLDSDDDKYRLFPYQDIVGIGKKGSTINIIRSIRRYFKRSTPDIVMAHGGKAFKYSVFARGLDTRPHIIYRKIGLSDKWISKFRWIRLLFYRWVFRYADMITTVGRNTRNELIELFDVNSTKVHVMYRGVSLSRFDLPSNIRNEVRNSLNISDSAPVLISVGSLSWEKNHEVIIRTVKQLKEECKDIVLLLVGDGDLKDKLEEYSEILGVQGFVRFLGERSDVPELLFAADIFVLSSLTEGVPGVLIEAGLAGKPSVAWDVAGVKEVLQNDITGFVTPYGDEVRFNEKIQDLLHDPERSMNMGKEAMRHCRDKFNIEECVTEHIALFEKLIKGEKIKGV